MATTPYLGTGASSPTAPTALSCPSALHLFAGPAYLHATGPAAVVGTSIAVTILAGVAGAILCIASDCPRRR